MCELRHLGRGRLLLPVGESLRMDLFEPVTCEFCLLGRYLNESGPFDPPGSWPAPERRREPFERRE